MPIQGKILTDRILAAMVNEKTLIKKVADFFNSLSFEEVVSLRKFMMTRKYTSFLETRLNNKKIEL